MYIYNLNFRTFDSIYLFTALQLRGETILPTSVTMYVTLIVIMRAISINVLIGEIVCRGTL